MSLKALAAADQAAIFSTSGEALIITEPGGSSAPVTGLDNDISQAFDPDTGQVVTGRAVTVAVRITELTTAGLSIPRGIADSGRKPWTATIGGVLFKVAESNPDRTLGVVVLILEAYR